MKKTFQLLFAGSLLTSVLVAGEDHTARAKEVIRKLDSDGDGKIAKKEFIGSASIFERWDADKDGLVTEAELAAGLAAPKPKANRPQADGPQADKPRRARLDANGDGKITEDEWPKRMPVSFKDADKNGDGIVDGKEAKAVQRRVGGNKSGADRLRAQVDGTLKRFDKNSDGLIAGDEIPARGAANWKKMDANGDGAIDKAELTAAYEARAKRFRGDIGKRIAKMDADKDGAVSREEWKGNANFFKTIDTDKDGVLSKAEIEAVSRNAKRRGGWKNRPSEALFRRMDADGDKRITKDEWKLNPELFARFDANADGVITADEVMPSDKRNEMAGGGDSSGFWKRYDKNQDGSIDAKEFGNKRRFAAMDNDGDGLLSKAEVAQALDKQDRERKMSFIERFDRDRDGKVTREEFTGPAKLFDKKDRNGDGVIDESEAAAGRAKKR